jgi:curved DNA-binding protein CbpA
MERDHYTVLGVGRNATAGEIKSAYRRLVLQHHPDRSKTAQSAAIFLQLTAAYDVLSDADSRRHYDATAESKRRVMNNFQEPTRPKSTQAESKFRTNTAQPAAAATKTKQSVVEDITKLSLIFTRGQFGESERLAKQILAKDARQSVPYAVLGDIYRAKGNLDEAAKMYAYAAQMDPRNPVYQQRHEELIADYRLGQSTRAQIQVESRNAVTLTVGVLCVVATAAYIVFAKEPSIAPGFSLINTWTLGLMVMLFLGGVVMGSVLCSAGQLDRFDFAVTNSLGKTSAPLVALTSIAIVNFWAAVAVFGGVSLAQRNYSKVHLKFLGGIAGTVAILGLAASATSNISAAQTLLWGGNLSYIGGVCGWMVADSFRRI